MIVNQLEQIENMKVVQRVVAFWILLRGKYKNLTSLMYKIIKNNFYKHYSKLIFTFETEKDHS